MRKVIVFTFVTLVITALGYLTFNSVFGKSNKTQEHKEDNLDSEETLEETLIYKTTYKEVPKDGSKPTDYDIYDNLAFIMQALENKDKYQTESVGLSKSGFLKVDIKASKYHSKEETYIEQISSGFISSAVMYYYYNGFVYERNAISQKGLNVTYSDFEPNKKTSQEFLEINGSMHTTLTPYIVSKDTILKSNDLEVLEDGNFKITIDLNPDSNFAPYYYQHEIKESSGSSILPVFNQITQTYIFDENWNILSLDVTEEYKIKIGFINPTAKTNTLETFIYNEPTFNSEAQTYFYKYR